MIRRMLKKPVFTTPRPPRAGDPALRTGRRPLWAPAPARFPFARLRRLAHALGLLPMLMLALPALADAGFEARLAEAVAEKAGGGRMIVELAPPRGQLPAEPAIGELSYDPRSTRFTATTADTAGKPLTLTGRAHPAVEVPVLARRLDKGEVIASGDIDYSLMRADRLSSQVVTDAGALIGLSARRPVAAGVALRDVDLEKPQVIAKGDLVTLSLAAPGMVLSLRGRALAGGGQGDVIRVANLTSNRVVAGTVDGPGVVSVPALP